MLKPTTDAKKSRKRVAPSKNTSSRTKTKSQDKKKNKPRKSRKQVLREIKKMIKSERLLLPQIFDEPLVQQWLDRFNSGPDPTVRRNRVYTPYVTLGLFIQQVLSKDRGCQETVTLLNKQRQDQDLKEVSTNTTSYCNARARIPLELTEHLMTETASLAFDSLQENWKWKGHRVRLVDGLVVNAPDTPDNQAKYPQTTSQKPGLGFPQIRVCASICLNTGVVTDVKYGPVFGKKTGEATLFRSMHDGFLAGDIVIGDSNFECYADMASLLARGVLMVCDINGSRRSPFTGPCAVIEETFETLARPSFNPDRFTLQQWEQLPETLTVRMIRYQVGGRKSEITIVTTLLDSEKYSAAEVAELYKHRWDCELDIRSIKSVMGLNWLSCHTPEMLERELMTYLLAYNLIRLAMCDAANLGNMVPRDLSFKNAANSWLHFSTDDQTDEDYSWLLWSIVDGRLRKRLGRNEPRKIKRRSNKYEKMKLPRDQEKAAMIA